jgi:hypothetical protein
MTDRARDFADAACSDFGGYCAEPVSDDCALVYMGEGEFEFVTSDDVDEVRAYRRSPEARAGRRDKVAAKKREKRRRWRENRRARDAARGA